MQNLHQKKLLEMGGVVALDRKNGTAVLEVTVRLLPRAFHYAAEEGGYLVQVSVVTTFFVCVRCCLHTLLCSVCLSRSMATTALPRLPAWLQIVQYGISDTNLTAVRVVATV